MNASLRAILADLYPWFIRGIGLAFIASAMTAATLATFAGCTKAIQPIKQTSTRAGVVGEEHGPAGCLPARPTGENESLQPGAGRK